MKNSLIIFSIFFLFISCNDVLDEELRGGVTADGTYPTPNGINFALNGTYAAFTEFMGTRNRAVNDRNNREVGWSLLTFGTDIYTNGSDGGNKSLNNYNTDLNASQSLVRVGWDALYLGINSANVVMARAPEVIEDQDELNHILAQASFLRAFYYYYLIRIYGPVHYTDEETVGVETEASRTPVDQIYTEIIEDLEFAEQNLPETQSDFGRPTSWAAKAFLADVYLTMEDYPQAGQFAEDVILNGPHELVSSYAELWDLDNEENSEVIWSVQFADNPAFDGGGNPAHMFFLTEYDKLPGMKRDIANGRPWKRFKPTEYLLGLYDMEDERYDGTFKTVWFSNNPASAPDGVEIGDTAVWYPRIALTQAEKDSRPFGVNIFNPDEIDGKNFPATNKWIQPNRDDIQQPEGGRDFIAWRLAEIYLIAAEAFALSPTPDMAKAARYLNIVRDRAYGDSPHPVATSVDIDIILEERAKEFAQEGKRWFDLVRTGLLVERVRLHNAEGSPNIRDFHKYRPIPLTQIDRTSNDFAQNDGY